MQPAPGRIEFHVAVARRLTGDERVQIMDLLKAAFDAEFDFGIIETTHLERTQAGKLRGFISKVAQHAAC